MTSLRRVVQQYFYTILLLMAAGGFVMLVIELLITNHTDGIQLAGVIASAIGLILAVAALFLTSLQARNILAILFIVLSVSGLIGVLQHFNARGEEGETALNVAGAASYQPVSLRSEDDDENPGEARGDESEAVPPPLAPLGLSGLALLGAITLLGILEPQAAAAQTPKPAARTATKPKR